MKAWRAVGGAVCAAVLVFLSLPASAAALPPWPGSLPPALRAQVLAQAKGPVYLVEAYPRARGKRLPALEVLAEWEGAALVAASPAALDSLAALGCEVRRVTDHGFLPAVPRSEVRAVAAYDPRVQALIDQVAQAGLMNMLNGLTGQTSVIIGGATQIIATRNSNLAGCRLAEQYAYETLEAAGLLVEYQSYHSGLWNNVIATRTGVVRPGRQILLTAHLDDMPGISSPTAPGADDNGSGSVVVLRAAQIMSTIPFEKTVRFICFTGEEQGLLGSDVYATAAAARGDTIDAVLNLDMIAYESDDSDVMELHAGTQSASGAIADAFIDVNTTYGLGLLPEKITTGSATASDHSSFWDVGYAAILAIEDMQDFTPFYHKTTDVVTTLDPDYFTRFARAAVGTVATLAGPAWTAAVETPTLPMLLSMGPSPTRRGAVLRLALPAPADVRMELFDLTGRRLRTLGGGIQPAGVTRIAWDGLDAEGREAPAGVVFYRVSAAGQVISGRIVVLK